MRIRSITITCLRSFATACLFMSVLIAQGSAPSVGKPPHRTATVFQMEGNELVAALQKNIYGLVDHEGVIRIDGGSIWFQPSDARDHLATAFLDVPSGIQIGVELEGVDAGTSRDLVVFLQNGKMENLALWRAAQENLSAGRWSTTTGVLSTDGKIRLVLSSAGLTALRLPSRVVIWYYKAPQPFLIWLLVAVFVLAGILIWFVRRRVRA